MSSLERHEAPNLPILGQGGQPPHEVAAMAWLAGHRNEHTRRAYLHDIRRWFEFCASNNVDPLRQARRVHVELYQRGLEAQGLKPRTIAGRLTSISSFYIYCDEEEWTTRNPMKGVDRPIVERKSPTGWLNRQQLGDLVLAAEELGPHPYALVSILAFNGLRIAEVCSLDVGSLSMESSYPVLTFIRKGGHQGRAVLARPTEAAVMAAIAERTEGPLLLTSKRYRTRMTQQAAQRILDKCVPAVRGVVPRVTPHVLRHSWCTAALAAHVPSDQVQHDGGWADQRLLSYYGHGHDAPARSATHAVSAYILGAT